MKMCHVFLVMRAERIIGKNLSLARHVGRDATPDTLRGDFIERGAFNLDRGVANANGDTVALNEVVFDSLRPLLVSRLRRFSLGVVHV